MSEGSSSYLSKINDEKMPAGKKKVILAALDLFSNRGFHATTTAAIAKRAGVSEGTIYKYFRSKEDLLSSLLIPLIVQLRDNFFIRFNDYSNLSDLIDFVIQDRLEFVEDNFEVIKLSIQDLLTDNYYTQQFKDSFSDQSGSNDFLQEIKDRFPEINQSLSTVQFVRVLLGPIISYVLQNRVFDLKSSQQEDMKLIKKQIMAGLIN